MNLSVTPIDVRRVISGIQERVEREYSAPTDLSAEAVGRLNALRAAYGQLYAVRNLVGQSPPSPDTLRARIGGKLVQMVQRALFWYTPQILRFHNDAVKTLGAAVSAIETQMQTIAEMNRQIRVLRAAQAVPSSTEEHAQMRESLPPAFEFALQNHFRGSEETVSRKLSQWFDAISNCLTETKAGIWLDIGCGRGEWLALLGARNIPCKGIDANPVCVEHCVARGLHAHCLPAAKYIESVPDNSVSVVTAFHVFEHLAIEERLALCALITRKLAPKGVLAIETPNPGNLLMSSNHFWNDPTHRNPIPIDLMEFMLRHLGFETIQRRFLNPAPQEEHLPFPELDPIRRLDELLYGCRDYGLIAIK